MPLQNRVTPTGDLIATDACGTLMGNRGMIHNPESRTLLKRRWTHHTWVCCRLAFKGRQRTVMGHGTYTELFFLDEVTALAAGHRPCGECRRTEFRAFTRAWREGNGTEHDGPVPIRVIDRQMHRDRVGRQRRQMRFDAPLESLPSGAMVLIGTQPHLVCDDHLFPWGERGYGSPSVRHRGTVTVLTPRSTVRALGAGYLPAVHGSVC